MFLLNVRKKSGYLTLTGISALLSIAVAAVLLLPMTSAAKNPNLEFEDPALIVVYSVTDDDAQIIARGGSEERIKKVAIFGPHGTVHLKAGFKDGDRLGQADFQFETPEPSLDDLKVAYPEGDYRFRGKTVDGDILESIVPLSYDLLPTPVMTYPKEGETEVPINGLVVEFSSDDAEAIRLEIEDEEEGVALKVDLPGNATSFVVPNGWLQSGTVYVLDIKAIAEWGNQTVVDVEFTTAE